MIHYTLNTGHSRVSPRAEVRDETIEICRPWIVPGRHLLPQPGWRVQIARDGRGMVFTVFEGVRPVLTAGVVDTAEAADVVWPAIESLYHQITELPVQRSADWQAARRPESLPWLSVVLIAIDDSYHRASWLGDFERCLA